MHAPHTRVNDVKTSDLEPLGNNLHPYPPSGQLLIHFPAERSVTAKASVTKPSAMLQVPPSRASYLVVNLVTASIVWKAASLLPLPDSPPHLHEAHLLHSMRAMAVVFLQMGTMHWFVSVVTMMDAAITWPFLIRVFSTFVVAICLIRSAPPSACRLHACTCSRRDVHGI